jgi:hypothetical protein
VPRPAVVVAAVSRRHYPPLRTVGVMSFAPSRKRRSGRETPP